MVQKGNVKKVFPGGNTSKGFYSFYDQIIPEDAERIFVKQGYDVESLDGTTSHAVVLLVR